MKTNYFVEAQNFFKNNKVLRQISEFMVVLHFLSNSKRVFAVQVTDKAALELGIEPNIPVGEGTPEMM